MEHVKMVHLLFFGVSSILCVIADMLIEIDLDTSSLWKHLRSSFTQIQTLSHQIKVAESVTGRPEQFIKLCCH
jgi:hypothetical protein